MTNSVYTHSTFEYVVVDVHSASKYGDSASCSSTYSNETNSVSRAITGVVWMATDAILWGAFFMLKGKAMSYLHTIRDEVDNKAIDGSELFYN